MGLNEKRTLLAAAYDSAPRARWGAHQRQIAAAASVNISALCPTQADLGDAPCYDVVISFNRNVIGSGLLGMVVTDDILQLGITDAMLGLEEVDGIRVKGLLPYDATLGGLRTPMDDGAGTIIENYLFVRNRQVAGALTFQMVFEIPDLDWIGGRMGMGVNMAEEFRRAARVRLNNETLANLALSTNVEITNRIPFRSQIDDAPFVDLKISYALQDVQSGPAISVGTAVNPQQQIGYRRRPVAAGMCVVECLRLRPRENTTSTTLLDGNRVFVCNTDAANAYADINVWCEVPTLNWV